MAVRFVEVGRVTDMERDQGDQRPRIGLALSSGGARGFAHVGVIKALNEAGLNIVNVAGSSMGSIMAAGYAVRGDVEELERWVLEFRARDHTRRGLLGLPIMDAERITSFLDTLFNGARFSDCALPLAIVATDLQRREATTLTAGPVALATYASMAMPFLHRPVPWEGRLLAEGSLSCVLPLAQARVAEAHLVVGSMASREWRRFDGVMTGLSGSVGRATRGWQRHYVDFFRARGLPAPLVDESTPPAPPEPPAVIVTPQLDCIGPLDFGKVRDAIAAGEQAALAKLGEIKALLGLG